MQSRRKFIKNTGIFSAGLLAIQSNAFGFNSDTFQFPLKDLVSKRPPLSERKFTSQAVEAAIVRIKKQIANPELAWLFENCFPNTLDTTVDFEIIDGKPDTYVITGDIDAMWLRDSTAQIWPYIPFVKEDPKLAELVKGVINRQAKCILLDPYANAFYKDFTKESEWKHDLTKMQPGIHERKWEIDSLCYPVRLAHGYWKETGDISLFDEQWKKAMLLVLQTFKEQQRLDGKGGPYSFQRQTAWATDGVPLGGYGYPVKPCGLIVSTFRPSDDSTLFGYLIPSNMFAIEVLGYLIEIFSLPALKDNDLVAKAKELREQVQKGLKENGIIDHPKFGKIIAFEVNGYGSFHMMDDANVPSLLSLPYLGAIAPNDPLYLNTRKVVLSENNPFFYKGKAGEGVGGPHTGVDTIWPMSIVLRAITSVDEKEIKACISNLIKTNADTGFMHESFHKDDVTKFTRKWFAWANTLFGEMIVHTSIQYPQILKDKNI
ncbi:glycoside hydrolase family 125 protein [Flavobacterium sp. CLA17]|uniref:glycoside hydrolase family 125 protein n=1 Tax=Flavobacterium sp. CLA17 TaxID=2724135 RepID=UPI001491CA22|nr:glycoside hydrolase family 125 protein [Flavobacterium sp. CLA17]QSB25605.1 glycoside hydrolase family 125 protein [Flavobacterium sp. CLA17]